jgi:DNA invertase Pin-like site-specific DNA recombinase
MTTKVFGYVRVSTLSQVTDRQLDALTAAGIKSEDIYSDKITGMRYDRPGMNEMLGKTREGDVVMVHDISRLGRNMAESITTANDLHERGIVLKSIKEGVDYSTPAGRLVAGIFASLAQFEREQMLERAAEARAAAQARGLTGGRPSRLTEAQKRQARTLHAGGESVAALVKTFGVSRRTIYRAIEAETADKALAEAAS